jgi:hypothetical protein
VIDTKINARRYDCWRLIRWSGFALQAMFFLATSPAVQANQCFTNGPRYRLEADTVDWRMTIHSNENCFRGVRLSYVYNANVSLVSLPRSGNVIISGPGFLYTAKPGFHGDDSFVISVSGSKNKTSGSSTIRVQVSVVASPETIKSPFAHFDTY